MSTIFNLLAKYNFALFRGGGGEPPPTPIGLCLIWPKFVLSAELKIKLCSFKFTLVVVTFLTKHFQVCFLHLISCSSCFYCMFTHSRVKDVLIFHYLFLLIDLAFKFLSWISNISIIHCNLIWIWYTKYIRVVLIFGILKFLCWQGLIWFEINKK